ncbi:S-adenosyl-L-homocysteine hydrolase [Parablastomonas sp. CN1-191]|uniref:S-adenosyl-L-homocysteine hydrolase n=1 Tax=Parablastomonas sp. CN1-191 TaxID=3400908 RepID=UPI003BF904C8
MTAHRVAAALAAVSMLAATPAQAATSSQAEGLRRLDIMLMVTGLRCRTTADNFQADYGRFTTKHYPELQAAALTMKADFAKRYGAAGANRALDKLSVQMANEYGQGHPWLDCSQLKQVTRGLATSEGSAALVDASRKLLQRSGSPQMALAALARPNRI